MEYGHNEIYEEIISLRNYVKSLKATVQKLEARVASLEQRSIPSCESAALLCSIIPPAQSNGHERQEIGL